jgi:hypothetical protein
MMYSSPTRRAGGAQAGHVGAGPGLAHAERGDAVTGDGGAQELFLLLARADVVDDRRGHVRLDQEAHGDARRVVARELLGLDDAHPEVAAAAAELLAEVRADDAAVAGPLEHLVGEQLRLLPRVGVRSELLLGEVADLLAKELVLFGEGIENHSCSPVARRREALGALNECAFIFYSVRGGVASPFPQTRKSPGSVGGQGSRARVRAASAAVGQRSMVSAPGPLSS